MISKIQSTANAATPPESPADKSTLPHEIAGIRERRRSELHSKLIFRTAPDVRAMLKLGWQSHSRWVMP